MAQNEKMQQALQKASSLKRDVEEAEKIRDEMQEIGGEAAGAAEKNVRDTTEAYEKSLRDVSDAKHGS